MSHSTDRNVCLGGCFCSVPGCSYGPHNAFPMDPEQRRQQNQAVRRDEGPEFCIKPGSTFVCSLHFTQEDFVSGSTISRLKSGAVASLFPWNHFFAPARLPLRGAQKRQLVLSQQTSQAEAATVDHDYVSPPPTDKYLRW
uniref:THAP-type domain-containing protein n=1 Tax=Gouania willdenowi TaxID=441366 RepID=A0A8C5HVG2_GOUWI